MNVDQDELRRERLMNPIEPGSKRGKKGDSGDPVPPGGGRRSGWALGLSIAGLVIGLVLAVFLWGFWKEQQEMNRQAAIMNEQITRLAESTRMIADRLEEDKQRMDSLGSDIEVVQKKVGVTENELRRARAVAEKIRQERERDVELLTDQIRAKADSQNLAALGEQTDTKFTEIDQKISVVKEDVSASRKEIEKTWQELTSLGLKMTEQGSLIATNAGGLDELRKRGERDYLQFDARKKRKIKVGDVVVELRKADTKRQRADLKLFYDDREVERKKVYTNSPIRFYVGRDKVPYELVINQVIKNQIRGYFSVPKGAAVASSPSLGSSSG